MSDLRDNIIDIIANSRTAYINDQIILPCSDDQVADEILKEMAKEIKKLMEIYGIE